MRNNILLFILVLVLSLATAPYFGGWYNQISPQYGGWMTDKESAVNFAGFIVSYIFFIPFIYGLFSIKKNKNWITWFLVPILLFWLGADPSYIYIPALLILIAFVLAKLINLTIKKFKHPNPPMIINK